MTQTIDEEGKLVGVMETVDFEDRDVADEDGRKKHEEDVIEKSKEDGAANIRDDM